MSAPEERRFRPRPMFEALERHAVEYVVIGGTAAVIHGATHLTFDLDITPARERQNLDRLAAALKDLGARPFGIPDDALQSFQLDGETLHKGSAWTFITEHGELDVALDPDGTQGYRDLIRDAREADAYGLLIRVASLADVIRSKEAANRDRDRAVLPDLRRTLELQRLRESR